VQNTHLKNNSLYPLKKSSMFDIIIRSRLKGIITRLMK
jgi:hypothetical protein